MATTAPRKRRRIHPALRFEQLDVTPAMAAEWLTRNEGNRPLKPAAIARYVRDMKARAWRETGEPIKFDWYDVLRDGQNRLSAVVESNCTVRMVVAFGVDPSVQEVMDTGVKRTGGDALGMRGYANRNLLASIASLGINWERGHIRVSTQTRLLEVTHSELIDCAVRHPELEEVASAAGGRLRGIPASATAVGFSLWVTSGIDPFAEAFFADVAQLRTDGKGDPRFTLARRLQAAKDKRERLGTVAQAYFILRAWKASRGNEQLHNLKLGNLAGPFAFPTLADLRGDA